MAQAARGHGHHQVIYHPDKSTLAETLFNLSQPGDILLTMGAGDIYRVGDQIMELFGGEKS